MENPKIRFKGFTKDWEQRKLGELVKEGILEAPLDGNHGEKHPTSDEYVDSGIPFLMASDIHNGEVNIYSCKYITKERAERLDKGFARNGDVLLTHKATIGETAILSNLMTEYAMLTPQVTYYRIKNEERLNREYLYSFFNSLDFQTELKTKAAQSTRPYIGITAQQNLKIILPAEINEQIRIGLYFRNLDHLITLHQRKCDQTKNLKKYMLQKMFPQNGAKVPEIRFDGYTYDWEQRKLDDVVEFLDTMRKPLEGAKRISGSYPYYGASGIVDYVDGYLFDEELILLSEDGANITDRNYPVCFLASGKYWVNNHAHVLRTKQGNENNFICNSLERKDYTQYNTGMAMPKLNKETCKKIPILCPEFEEQKKIGDYFRSLDHLITLHQRKCDELKKMKKYMLQNMFI